MTTRRDFIRTSALLTAGAATVPLAACALPKNKDRLGVALVGLGYYSTDLLAPALLQTKKCYLAGIVTGSPEKAARWQKQYNLPDKNIYNYQNFDKIADNPDIDVVYVVLPPSMHAEYTIRAAKAGKHVWCEKPMAPTVADCQAMIKACRDNKVALSIGYRTQHDPNIREIIRLRRENALGKVRLVTASSGYFESRKDNWKQKKAMGGGAMGDMGVYALQAARYVTGEEPVSVTAQQFTNRPEIYTEVDETTLFQLQFPSGAVANCATSFGMSMNQLQASFDNGWLKMEPFQAYGGIKGESSKGVIDFKIGNQQALQMDNDATAIMDKKPLLVPGEEGLRDIRVVEAVYQAARTGKAVRLNG